MDNSGMEYLEEKAGERIIAIKTDIRSVIRYVEEQIIEQALLMERQIRFCEDTEIDERIVATSEEFFDGEPIYRLTVILKKLKGILE